MAAVGKPRDAALAAAIREYETRAARYWPLEIVEVKEESAKAVSEAVVMRKEGERLLERIPPGARLVLCDPGGESMDSRTFAAMLQQQRERAQDVAFVIGGAHGLGDVVRARPHRRLAQANHRLLADAVERIAQAHRGCGLAFAGGRRRDRRDQHQFAVWPILQRRQIIAR